MTKKDKDLLLADLCSRLKYGVKGLHREGIKCLMTIDWGYGEPAIKVNGYDAWFPVESFKPYLRPMSSMSENEINELWNLCDFYVSYNDNDNFSHQCIEIMSENCRDNQKYPEPILTYEVIDWLNAHHFDYRGLIEKGLALEATKGIYL